jgi:hypothetical protein
MRLNGKMKMEQIMDAIPDNEFMQFHYALKDLTSLWFKGSLMDAIDAEKSISEKREADVKSALKKIIDLGPVDLAAIIAETLTANIGLLGWYYGVRAANNQDLEYNWDEFRTYNMPGIPGFRASLEKSCAAFIQYLQAEAPDPTILSRYKQVKALGIKIVFLQRIYKVGEVYYRIAPWEGRWDTIKPVIIPDPQPEVKQPPRYLVEHRNN